jgi:hypothetical protein
MHRPLGRAALVVWLWLLEAKPLPSGLSAPFSLAVPKGRLRTRSASLPRSLGARSFARLGRRARAPPKAGLFKCNPRWLAPAGQLLPGLACSGFSPAGFRSLRRLSFRQFCPSASLKLACSGLIRLRRIRQPVLANLAAPSGRSQLILLAWRCSWGSAPNPAGTF